MTFFFFINKNSDQSQSFLPHSKKKNEKKKKKKMKRKKRKKRKEKRNCQGIILNGSTWSLQHNV